MIMSVARDPDRTFNGPVEVGLRSLVILSEAYPDRYSLERLVVFDYFVVHSDDIDDGPVGLHPKTPHRSGELLVRRSAVRQGIKLYASRGLLTEHYSTDGIYFTATDVSAQFVDALTTEYVGLLRQRASWVINRFRTYSDEEVSRMADENVGEWGAEFVMESVLWEDTQ